ncbi:MAG: UDP-2,4-diacetamido-2,4,6-trideoxy-beta-L-altropyranose hydrolase, partial [Actinomycetota bacterium]|nr:UDP-2,4-diacetamido-2,4,6-trideoxy-beta-L-altropyranose hydrolase [Actinomycetota bacterium]
MKIAFRVDSSIHIGSGHISRCTALARALRRKGAEVVFVCAELHGSHDFIVQHAGFDVLTVPEGDPKSDAIDTVATLGTQVDWLVVDHY